jgi:FKBP-type peptidyl-prolyl cis-trans isomerase 2
VVAAGDAISVHYVGTLDDGEQFDSSRDRDQPLSFVVASGQMIAGFDAAVHGMKLGEVKTVRIEPADAYGDVFAVPIDQVPAGTVAGDRLSASTGQSFQVVTVTETEAMLLPDHPLAGQALNFEIEIVSFDN